MKHTTLCCGLALTAAVGLLTACGGSNTKGEGIDTIPTLNAQGEVIDADSAVAVKEQGLPFSPDDVREHVVMAYGKRTIRTDADKTISMPEKMKDKKNCFIVMSKKDYYLYVYEPQGADTVMLARYDCAFSLRKGQKEVSGDMKTPHCTMDNAFSVQQIQPASDWSHDFGDGRGSIKSYGDYFLRLKTPGHSGIGIHGSTNNRESVPGRASEGCIRLKDEDIKELTENYVTVGMKVVIKAENVDDYPFEIHAFKKQNIARKRHFDPRKTLTNEQIDKANASTAAAPAAAPAAEEAAQPETNAPAAAPAARVVKITGSNVRLRLGPSTDKEILKDADGNPIYPAKGDVLPCKAMVGDWYMVDFNGKAVYVNKQFATPQ